MSAKVEKKIDDRWVECHPSEIKKGDIFRTFQDGEIDQWSYTYGPDFQITAISDAVAHLTLNIEDDAVWGIMINPVPCELYIRVKK
jgi:hypothetical protein